MGTEPRALWVLGKHSSHWGTSLPSLPCHHVWDILCFYTHVLRIVLILNTFSHHRFKPLHLHKLHSFLNGFLLCCQKEDIISLMTSYIQILCLASNNASLYSFYLKFILLFFFFLTLPHGFQDHTQVGLLVCLSSVCLRSSHYSPGWPCTFSSPCASAFEVLGSQAWATVMASSLVDLRIFQHVYSQGISITRKAPPPPPLPAGLLKPLLPPTSGFYSWPSALKGIWRDSFDCLIASPSVPPKFQQARSSCCLQLLLLWECFCPVVAGLVPFCYFLWRPSLNIS